MTHTLRLVDRDNTSSVRFDFDDQTGLSNPAAVKSWVLNFDIGRVEAPLDIVKAHGSAVARRVMSDPQTREVTITFAVQAPDKKTRTLVAGVGDLYRRLQSENAEDYLLAWDDGDGVRFFEPLGVENAMPNMRNEAMQPLVTRSGDDTNLEMTILCQPYILGASDVTQTQTLTSDVYTNATGRTLPFTVDGEGPTPIKVEIIPTTSTQMTSVRMAAREMNSTDSAAYRTNTKWAPGGASAHGWTVTLHAQTTVKSDAVDRIGPSVANISIPSTLTDTFYKRWRAVRTTDLNSLRGEWAVYARVFAVGSEKWSMQLRWGAQNVDPVANTEPKVTHKIDIGDASAWEDVYLGTIAFPEVDPFSAAVLELWASRDTGNITSDLWFNGMFLMPASPNSRVYMRSGGTTTYDQFEMVTPTANIGTDPNWTSGERLGSGAVRVSSGESVGIRPNEGTAYGQGRSIFRVEVSRRDDTANDNDVKFQIIERNTNTVLKTVAVSKAGTFHKGINTLSNVLYQARVTNQAAGPNRFVTVTKFEREYIPVLGTSGIIICDPENTDVLRADASGNIAGPMKIDGAVPFVLEPGDYVLCFIPGYLAEEGHDGDTSPNPSQSFTIRTTYRPRYLQ